MTITNRRLRQTQQTTNETYHCEVQCAVREQYYHCGAAAQDGYFLIPDVPRLLRLRAHVDEGQDVVERNIQRDGSPRLQISTRDSLLWRHSLKLKK